MRRPPKCSLFVSAPLDTLHLACTRSVSRNHIGVEGGKAIAAVLKDTQITTLECASALEPRSVLAFMSSPLDILHFSCTRSMEYNGLMDEGCMAIAAVLPQTQVKELKCAAPQVCSLLCQRPMTFCTFPALAVSGGTASRSRAARRSLLCCRQQS